MASRAEIKQNLHMVVGVGPGWPEENKRNLSWAHLPGCRKSNTPLCVVWTRPWLARARLMGLATLVPYIKQARHVSGEEQIKKSTKKGIRKRK